MLYADKLYADKLYADKLYADKLFTAFIAASSRLSAVFTGMPLALSTSMAFITFVPARNHHYNPAKFISELQTNFGEARAPT